MSRATLMRPVAAALFAVLPLASQAAAGMWPLDQLPMQALAAHGLHPDVPQLMRASVRLPYGSASFVSARGLLLTNHHVVSECIAALSSRREPLLQRGFLARQARQERRCPGMEAEVLQGIDTLEGELPTQAVERKQQLERWTVAECPSGQRCEAVLLHGGARVQRYRYRVYDDVRLAFAPEAQASNFGGDEDNFNFPRYAFDFALLRVYSGGRPIRPAHWLRPATGNGPGPGDALMVPGHPYSTQRLLTVAQLEAERDHAQPARIARSEAERAALKAFVRRGPEAARQAADPLATVENSLKALRGELRALQDPALMQAKAASEVQVRHATADPLPWVQAAASAAATARWVERAEAQRLPAGTLLDLLLHLLALREERALPEGERLVPYAAPAEQALRLRAAAEATLNPEMEAAQLAAHLAHARQRLGTSNEWVQAWQTGMPGAQGADPTELLTGWLRLTRLQHAAERLSLLEGELPSDEPLVQLAARLLPLHLALERAWEREVEQPLHGASEALARARWQVLGAQEAPDATFTLRLSFGRVGPPSGQRTAPAAPAGWQTDLAGLFARARERKGQPEFRMPPMLAAASHRLDPRTPLNFTVSADIVGGNSGSPVLDARGAWVGLAFDGNLESLAGSYHFDEDSHRTVALHRHAIRAALRQVYGARMLADELGL